MRTREHRERASGWSRPERAFRSRRRGRHGQRHHKNGSGVHPEAKGRSALRHSYCFICSTYFYDQLVETCPRCQARVSGLTQQDLTDLGLLHRTLPAESHHSPVETANARPTAA